VLHKFCVCNSRPVSRLKINSPRKNCNEINNLQQRERERLDIYLFIVTVLQGFEYEKLERRFGSLAEVLRLKVCPEARGAGELHNPCNTVTSADN
jgi:hypothetical protein